jgi:hypothetical protein
MRCNKKWWLLFIVYTLIIFCSHSSAAVESNTGNIHFDVNSDGVPEASLISGSLAVGSNFTPSANLHVQGNALVSGDLSVGGTSGCSNLNIQGTMGFSIETISDNTTLSGNSLVFVNTSAGNITVTLPYAGNVLGRIYTIKHISVSNKVTISPTSGFIDGYDNLEMTPSNTALPFVHLISSSSTRWHILAESGTSDAVYSLSGNTPALDFAFAANGSLVDRISGQNLITFSRNTIATYLDSSGQVQTAAAHEARFTHDPETGQGLGLMIEEQRTNLVLNSASLSTQGVMVPAAEHWLHFTGTGSISLSGTHTATLNGTGSGETNRVFLQFTPSAGTLTLTVSGTVENVQLEEGKCPTSYIPTTGAQVTRDADVATITGTNFSSWFSHAQGTTYADFRSIYSTVTPDQSKHVFYIQNAGFDDYKNVYIKTDSSVRASGKSGSVDDTELTLGGIGTHSNKAISAFGSDVAGSVNGGTVVTGSNGGARGTASDIMYLGGRNSTTQYLNGTISRLVFWSERLDNNELVNLTE